MRRRTVSYNRRGDRGESREGHSLTMDEKGAGIPLVNTNYQSCSFGCLKWNKSNNLSNAFWEFRTNCPLDPQCLFQHGLARCWEFFFLWLWPLRDHIKQKHAQVLFKNQLHEEHIIQNRGRNSALDKLSSASWANHLIFLPNELVCRASLRLQKESRLSREELSASVLNQKDFLSSFFLQPQHRVTCEIADLLEIGHIIFPYLLACDILKLIFCSFSTWGIWVNNLYQLLV